MPLFAALIPTADWSGPQWWFVFFPLVWFGFFVLAFFVLRRFGAWGCGRGPGYGAALPPLDPGPRRGPTVIRKGYLWLLKNTLNRVTVRAARKGGGPFSLIRHVGRRSGKTYETPVVLARVPEGFVAELTYGEKVNWLRNIEAAGGCVVVFGGEEYRVEGIEPLDAATGRAAFPTFRRALLTATRRTNFRLLRTCG